MQTKQYPFYIKSTVVLLGLVLITYILINLSDLLVPVSFSVIIAILLNPLVTFFKRRNIPHVIAILLSMLIAFAIVGGLFYFLSSQIIGFGQNLPLLKSKFANILGQLQQWLQMKFGVDVKNPMTLINDTLGNSKALVGKTVGTALSTLSVVFLLPVYIFLFLFYKTLILNFLFEVFSEENSKEVSEILNQTKTAIQSYMVGLLIEALIVAAMNSAALMFLRVEYAILLGVIGALLNMIPYIGGIIAIALPVLIATVTKDGFSTQLGIIIAYAVIQFIDNNILVPRIVSSKVQINALFSIIIVLLGGALWGVSGMFLSIPAIAILKIIFDRIDDLKPWGKLLGDEVPTRHKGQIWTRRKKKKSVSEEIIES